MKPKGAGQHRKPAACDNAQMCPHKKEAAQEQQQIQEEQCNTSSFQNSHIVYQCMLNEKDLVGFWSSSDRCQIHAHLAEFGLSNLISPTPSFPQEKKSSWKSPADIYRDYNTVLQHLLHNNSSDKKSKSWTANKLLDNRQNHTCFKISVIA